MQCSLNNLLIVDEGGRQQNAVRVNFNLNNAVEEAVVGDRREAAGLTRTGFFFFEKIH